MTDAVYTLHVNDEVLAAGVPGTVQGRYRGRDGELRIIVAHVASEIPFLPRSMRLGCYRDRPFTLVSYPISKIEIKENQHG